MIRGYHYRKNMIICPFIEYFKLGKKEDYLKAFDWYSKEYSKCFAQVVNEYDLDNRMEYGFPIGIDEYSSSMKQLVLSLNKNFKNRINLCYNDIGVD